LPVTCTKYSSWLLLPALSFVTAVIYRTQLQLNTTYELNGVKFSPSTRNKTKRALTPAWTVMVQEPRGGWSDNCNELLKTPVKFN